MLHTFLLLLPALLLAPFVIFVAMITIGSWRFRGLKARPSSPSTKFVILIPAHNEAASIGGVLTGLKKLDYPAAMHQVMVIADNCSDDTAAIARAHGALVYERNNLSMRGKGHALAEVTSKIVSQTIEGLIAVDAVIMIDADTMVDSDLLIAFDQGVQSGYDWMQGYYNGSNPDESMRTGLMALALSLFNGVWNQGIDRLGLSVPLRGNGMCMTVSGLKRQPWKAYGLAEDLEFAWALRLSGERVRFLPAARVYGELVANSPQAEESQRLRWEHGRKVLRKIFSFMLKRAKMPLTDKICYFIDLYMLPISTLAMYVILASGSAIAVNLGLGGHYHHIVTVIYLAELSVIAAYLASPALLGFTPLKTYGYLVRLPRFVVWKLVLWFKKKPTAWVRTTRSQEVSR